jgi:hypothetical protein
VLERGEVYRIVDRDREAFHAGRSMWNAKEDCDEYSVGIEVVGYHDKSMPLRQLEALKELVSRLKKIYNLKDEQVVCHSHVAYGAPNVWHKKKHRGRKRCGMLFAMPSVRAKLGLKARPASDPDVKAKRLSQADSYLASVLYGRVDTMTAFYGKPPAGVVRPVTMVASKTSATKPGVKRQSAKSPQFRRPPLTVPTKGKGGDSASVAPVQAVAEVEERLEERGWLTVLGLKGGYFKKRARLVVPNEGDAAPKGETLPLPENLHVGRMGDDVKNLEALVKLRGYTRGGPVSARLSPYKIAGAAWKSSSTYYYGPRGHITTGDKVDEKSIEAGTFLFFRK